MVNHTGNSSTNVNNLLFLKNDHASATGTTGIKIQQDSSGYAMDVRSKFTSAADAGAKLRLHTDDTATMASGHRLGVIEFAGAEDGSNNIITGARIEALATEAWDASNNDAALVFYTTAGNNSQSEQMRISADGIVAVGIGSVPYPASRFHSYTTTNSTYAISARNDSGATTGWGMAIICGQDDPTGTNVALSILDGAGNGQGEITFSGGTVAYGTFTANHDAELPESDNEDGYPYGTLVEHTGIFYKKKTGIGQDGTEEFERGILYKAQKSSSAYAKNVLGVYANKYKDVPDEPENLHQIYVLGDGHILCNGEKGNIAVGDGICTSSTDGEGMKTDKMAMIIGIAQEDVSFSGSESKLVAVQYGLSQFTPWT
jgi:hypothetical protein